jgi:hypothetical protein
VYFNTVAFDTCKHHHYAKLVPEAYCDPEKMRCAMRDGEGELSVGNEKFVRFVLF